MDLVRFISELKSITEAPYSGWVGAAGRPDADYVGNAYKNDPKYFGGKGFPYDRDRDEDSWETGRDMHSGDREEDHEPLTPRARGQTKKSGFEEAAGTPVNQTIGSRGSSLTGNPAGGMGGGWGNRPTKPWDEDEVDDEDLAIYGKDTLESVAVSPIPNSTDPAGLEPAEDSTEGDEFDFTDFPSVLLQVVGSGFGTGLGKANPSGRGFMQGWTEDTDIMAAESAWRALFRMMGLAESP